MNIYLNVGLTSEPAAEYSENTSREAEDDFPLSSMSERFKLRADLTGLPREPVLFLIFTMRLITRPDVRALR